MYITIFKRFRVFIYIYIIISLTTSAVRSTTLRVDSRLKELACCAFFFFFHTSTFQLLDKPWSQVSSLLPPGSCLQFLSRIGFSNPTARRFFTECC